MKTRKKTFKVNIASKDGLDLQARMYIKERDEIKVIEETYNQKITELKKELSNKVKGRKTKQKIRLKAIAKFTLDRMFDVKKVLSMYSKDGTSYVLKRTVSKKIITKNTPEETIAALNNPIIHKYLEEQGIGLGELIKKGFETLNKSQLAQLHKDDDAKPILDLLGIDQIESYNVIVDNKEDGRVTSDMDIISEKDEV